MVDDGATAGADAPRGLPWTAGALAALAIVQAILIFEHARRLLTNIVTAEETLGIAALGPLDREVPAALLEGFAALGLVIAAIAVLRRSQLALVYVLGVQAIVALDVVLRLVGGLAVGPALLLLGFAIVVTVVTVAPATRRWCVEPLWG